MSKYQEEALQIANKIILTGLGCCEDIPTLRQYVSKLLGHGSYVSYFDEKIHMIIFVRKKYIRQLLDL